jgi:translocation and assembly module TamB
MVEKNITRLLNRPLNLGQVESFSFNGLRFGASKVPATPTDPDRVSIEAVDVAFNPLKLILNRTLELEITLLKPDVYIEQDKQRVWVSTQLQTLEKGAIDVKLQALRVRDANVVLVPRSQAGKLQQPVAILLPSGASRFLK